MREQWDREKKALEMEVAGYEKKVHDGMEALRRVEEAAAAERERMRAERDRAQGVREEEKREWDGERGRLEATLRAAERSFYVLHRSNSFVKFFIFYRSCSTPYYPILVDTYIHL